MPGILKGPASSGKKKRVRLDLTPNEKAIGQDVVEGSDEPNMLIFIGFCQVLGHQGLSS